MPESKQYRFTVTATAENVTDGKTMQAVTLTQNCDYASLVLLQSLFLQPLNKLAEIGAEKASESK